MGSLREAARHQEAALCLKKSAPQAMSRPPEDSWEAKCAATRARVQNGYGITTSLYSISHLGHADFTTEAPAPRGRRPRRASTRLGRGSSRGRGACRDAVRPRGPPPKESSSVRPPPRRRRDPAPAQATKGRKTQSDALVFGKLHNVSRKNLHMQVAYPETVAKLQPPWGDLTRKQTPRALKTFDPALAVTRGCERLEPYERTNPGMARTMFIPGRIPVGPGFALALKNTTPAVRRCKDHRRRRSCLSADPDRPSQPRRRKGETPPR